MTNFIKQYWPGAVCVALFLVAFNYGMHKDKSIQCSNDETAYAECQQ